MSLSKYSAKYRAGLLMLAAMALSNGVSAMELSNGGSPASPPVDPLTWLEDRTSPRALEWVKEQNAKTLAHFTADPLFRRNYDRALTVTLAPDRLPGTDSTGWVYRGVIYQVWTDDSNPRGVVRRTSLQDFRSSSPNWQTVLDVGALGRADGREYSFFLPPPCMRSRCMVPLLAVGDSAVTWIEFDLDKLAIVKDGFRIQSDTALQWTHRDSLIVHTQESSVVDGSAITRWVVKEWSRGQPLTAAKTLIAAPDAHTELFARVLADDRETRVHIQQRGSDGRDAKHWKLTADYRLQPLYSPPKVALVTYHAGQWIYLLAADWRTKNEQWSAGSLIAIDDSGDQAEPPTVRRVVQPGAREMIDSLTATSDGLLVIAYSNVRGRLARFTFDGRDWVRKEVALPDFGTVAFGMHGAPQSSETLVKFENSLQPPTLYHVDVATGRAKKIKSTRPRFSAERLVSEQFEAASQDGTRIPYFVVRPKDLAYDGLAPTLMHAYGGNGMPVYPHYDGTLGKLWLEQGGVYVIANIRGGGEFGPAWHHAAVKTNRERAFEDFVAVAQDLIRRKITSPRHLGATGFSNGGGLMGVMFNRHPELFSAIVAENGVMDWIRTDLQNATAYVEQERGSPKIPQERAFLEKVSPYQNLRKRAAPIPLVVTSTTDDNVFPAMPRKYAARLQALRMPYYFFEAEEGGHGQFVTPKQQATYYALKYTYLTQQLVGSSGSARASE
jgi:prolyl oligopeptidase